MKDPGTQKAPEMTKVGEIVDKSTCTDRGFWEPNETPTDFDQDIQPEFSKPGGFKI